MSRFKGWDMKAVNKLQNQGSVNVAENYSKNIPKPKSEGVDYLGKIVSALEILGVQEGKREYKFLHDRRFRFDWALPSAMVAVEFEGGIFTNGRHTRAKGYSNDAKKYNLAVMHGWKLLRFTTADTQEANWPFVIAAQIKQVVEGSK